MYTLLVAATLIIADPKEPYAEGEAAFQEFAPVMKMLAIEWEIMDRREARYVLVRPEDFTNDTALLRQRYHDLHDAPPSIDSERFPPRAIVNDYLAFNREYRQQMDVAAPGESGRWWQIRSTLNEIDNLYYIWDAVRDAGCEYYYVTVRRQALKRLLETIGPDAYYSGQLPPYVPLWRFQEIP